MLEKGRCGQISLCSNYSRWRQGVESNAEGAVGESRAFRSVIKRRNMSGRLEKIIDY